MTNTTTTNNSQYTDFVTSIKRKIKQAKSHAALSVNKQLITLYFDIGQEFVTKQESLGWGKSVVEKIAKDL